MEHSTLSDTVARWAPIIHSSSPTPRPRQYFADTVATSRHHDDCHHGERIFAVSLSIPTQTNPAGIALTGKNYYYQTPYDISLNFQLQWQFTNHDSIQSGYVGRWAGTWTVPSTSHNSVSEMLIPGTAIQTINQANPGASTGFLPYNGSAPVRIADDQHDQQLPLVADRVRSQVR